MILLNLIIYLYQAEINWSSVTEQRVKIKFYIKVKKTYTETFKLLKKSIWGLLFFLKKSYDWFGRFRVGRKISENDLENGCLKTSNTESYTENAHQMLNINYVRFKM